MSDDPNNQSEEEPWQSLTVDEAIEHLKTWIDGIDDPKELARLMMEICGCEQAGYRDTDGRIYFQVP